MSTKIHNGWLLKGIDMPELLRRLRKLREDVYRIAAEYMAERAAAVAVCQIDRSKMLRKKLVADDGDGRRRPGLDLPISFHATWQIRDLAIESYDKMERTGLDLACEIVAVPFTWKKTDITLLLFYDNSPGNLYLRSFKKHVKPIEFAYWNNTDPPDDVSDSEWNERQRIWDAAIGADPPAERGFTFECMTKHRVPMIFDNRLIAEVKKITFKDRLDTIAREYAEDCRFRLMKRRKKEVKISDVWQWRRTPAGQRAVDRARELARRRLPHSITTKMLKAPMSTIARPNK